VVRLLCRLICNAGANRGLGLGLAKKLVASGRKVLLAARTHEKGVQPLLVQTLHSARADMHVGARGDACG
jgi:NAD(P)-dependent dehydrogenase (short-subunit alcohol dehydrogenase family)